MNTVGVKRTELGGFLEKWFELCLNITKICPFQSSNHYPWGRNVVWIEMCFNWKSHTNMKKRNARLRVCVLSCFSLVWHCDPMDCSLPGSSVHGILQARVLECVAVPSPGHLHKPGIKPMSLALQSDSLTSKPPGEALLVWCSPTCLFWLLLPMFLVLYPKIIAKTNSKGLSPMFSFRSFTVSGLLLKSLIHLS